MPTHASDSSGNLIINLSAIPLGCDSLNADYAFIISDFSISSSLKQTKAHTNSNLSDKYNITVAPNPSNGIFKLIVSSGDGKYPCSVNVIDLTGKTVWSNNLSQPSSIVVNLSDKPKGIYYIRVESNDSFSVKKIVLF